MEADIFSLYSQLSVIWEFEQQMAPEGFKQFTSEAVLKRLSCALATAIKWPVPPVVVTGRQLLIVFNEWCEVPVLLIWIKYLNLETLYVWSYRGSEASVHCTLQTHTHCKVSSSPVWPHMWCKLMFPGDTAKWLVGDLGHRHHIVFRLSSHRIVWDTMSLLARIQYTYWYLAFSEFVLFILNMQVVHGFPIDTKQFLCTI